MLKEGDKAPAFSLQDQNGKTHKLSDYKGEKLVIYFYPRDNTPGCTTEACSFRDDFKDYKKNKINIIGISKDSVKSHKSFEEKYELPFTLLSDESTKVIEAYGAWKEKSMYGKTFLGINRITYIIDEKGKVMKAYPKVKVKEHAKEILEFIKNN